MAAMPAPMTDDSSHSLIMADSSIAASAMAHHGNQEEPSKAPCHENTTDTASSESCDNCDIDCMNGICASSCVISGAAAFQKSSINLDLFSSTLRAASSGARAYGLPLVFSILQNTPDFPIGVTAPVISEFLNIDLLT